MSAPAPMAFGSKAETLERLAPLVRSACVLPQVRFTTGAWCEDPEAALARIRARGWLAIPVIVRSSALAEDQARASQAGRLRFIGGQRGEAAVRAAIGALAGGRNGTQHADQVSVQPELQDVRMSGVVLTRDPSNGSHYTIVSYDVCSGRADSITSGRAESRRSYYHHADCPHPPPTELAGVLALARELEELFAADGPGSMGGMGAAEAVRALEIEFAVTADGALWLSQVRALAVPAGAPLGRQAQTHALARIHERLAALGAPHPYLYGTRAVFGCMPDWNPAEGIGVRPSPLALSLYKELVTDSLWAYQPKSYGYRDLRSFPLLVSLGGLPYIDLRVSFNSFLPADVEEDLGRRLVDHYTERLLASPLAHDKVALAIVHSCYTLDLPARLRELVERGFSRWECDRLGASLRALTNRISARPDGPFWMDLEQIRELERRQAACERDARDLDPVARIHWQLEDCKRYGTLPFAGIARAAFLALQLLDSLVAAGVLSRAERERFLRSLHTVRGALGADLARMSRAAFLRRYGHLRPGTYDVTSARYDETPEAYFDWSASRPREEAAPAAPFALSPRQARRLDQLLDEHGLAHDHHSLFAFLRAALEGREHAQFVFSRSLSDALAGLLELADALGLSRADLACADIDVVRRLHAGSEDPRAVLEASIQAGQRRCALTRQLSLPPLIRAPSDVHAFHLPSSEPSYVTLESTVGPVVEAGARGGELEGAIVMIQSADPGHDWIFSRAVAGFITMYGGYDSHMAIRAHELGIPAVIGAGASLFQAWAAASVLRVDCLNRRVEVLA